MLMRTRELDAPRRVIAYQLLFGLLTVTLLTFGTVQVVLSVFDRQADSSTLAMMGKAIPTIRHDLRQNNGERVPELLNHLVKEYALEHGALIHPNHTYIAHTVPGRVGEKSAEVIGVVAEWGEVQRLTGKLGDAETLILYRAPIRSGDDILGIMEAARRPNDWWKIFVIATDQGIIFVVLGLVTCALGSLFAWRMLAPIAGVEQQLRGLASADQTISNLAAIPAASLVAVGWNRLVGEAGKSTKHTDLEARVSAGLRSHREKRAEAILRSLTDGVALTDHEDRITFINNAFEGIVNISSDRILGRSMNEMLRLSEGSDAAKKFLDHQYRAQQLVAEVGRDGDLAQGVLRVARLPLVGTGAESPTSHVWTIRDVTQFKLADQMRNQFVYSATHELRTPLANIRAYAETLTNSPVMDVERQKEFCNTINLEASRLSRFIDDLLSISRMEAGALVLQRHETDLMRLSEEVVAKVRPEMDAKAISFRVSLPPKMPKLSIDKDKINVALVNLLGNAAKYTPEGGHVALEIEWQKDAIEFQVIDTGIGIAAEEVEKIFDKFYRCDDPRVRDCNGSGLGLAIANEIARLHGGRIAVHSELDKGSKFTLILPTNG